MATRKDIPVENLHLDQINPRLKFSAKNQIHSITSLLNKDGQKVYRLGQHISKYGLNPSQNMIVIPDGDSGYIVLDGNRRLTALKLLNVPDLVESEYQKRFRKLSQDWPARDDCREVSCVLCRDRDEARPWIELNHLGENNGVGTSPWGTEEKERFANQLSPGTIVVNYLKDNDIIDDDIKVSITTLNRVFDSKTRRERLGFNITSDHNLVIDGDPEIIKKALTTIVTDIAKGTKNGGKDSRSLHSAGDRDHYVEEVLAKCSVQSSQASSSRAPQGKSSSSSSTSTSTQTKRTSNSSGSLERKTMVPSGLHLNIANARIEQMFKELKTLQLSKFCNAAAVLFRVFMELSVESYISTNNIQVTGRRSGLADQLNAVIDHLKNNQAIDSKQATVLRRHFVNNDSILSVSSWQSYVHDDFVYPKEESLKKIWNEVEVIVKHIWK